MCIFLPVGWVLARDTNYLDGRKILIKMTTCLTLSGRNRRQINTHYYSVTCVFVPKTNSRFDRQVLPLAKSKGSFSGRIPRAGASVTNTFHLQVTKTQEFRSTQPFLAILNSTTNCKDGQFPALRGARGISILRFLFMHRFSVFDTRTLAVRFCLWQVCPRKSSQIENHEPEGSFRSVWSPEPGVAAVFVFIIK